MPASRIGNTSINTVSGKSHTINGGEDVTKKGLTSAEANERLAKYGYNETKIKRKSPYVLLLRKFWGPVQLILYLVAVLSYALGRLDDFYIIVALLVFNSIIGFLEEYRADKSVEALKSMLAPDARVLRDGKWGAIPARFLVPGDTIRVRQGDIIPADAKITESDLLETDESIITGESFLLEKGEGSQIYQGSVVKRGEATCIITGTGSSTKYGITEKLVQAAKPASHLETVILKLMRYLVAGDSVAIAIMFIYGILVLHEGALPLLSFLLVVLVASVPVALSAAFTIAMAVGTGKLARKSVIVTRLEAMEDIATMSVLCADKTGTLTQNSITVRQVIPYNCDKKLLIKYAAEASRTEDKDPIDNAVLEYSSTERIKAGRQISFNPFDPSTKRTQAEIYDKGRYEATKGATPAVMRLLKLSASMKKRVDSDVEMLANKGLKSIAVATKTKNSGWKLAGLIALYDPPRPEAKRLIRELRDLGISVKMITGDGLPVAREIAGEVGLGRNMLMLGSGRSKINDRIMKADGFAGVYPEDKYTIVKALQEKGLVIGMTGDGVNDAPALKEAEVGIAVANATDVAKSSAALNLTKNGLGVIVDAVKESRRIFERMATYTMSKVAKVFQIVGFVSVTFIAFGFTPITPFLLILLIFTNDIANISLSTDNAVYSNKPDAWNMRSLVYSSGIIGILLVFEALIFIPLGFGILGLSMAQFQTMIFLMLNVTDKFTVFSIRERRAFWKSAPSIGLAAVSAIGIIAGVVLSYFGILIPEIGAMPIVLVLALSALFMLINDVVKRAAFKHFGIS
ncbi:MAG: plasma-membrane proton-efflux P-type ATPase [Candidatus Marsarchaeota archaeon]|nr:plasma-membrane proton-efflux P-type ATPase [Candidatus Marsarchaeota archaeon]